MNKAVEIYACLYAKEFPIQALLRLRPELRSVPTVAMDGEPPMQQVCSVNAKARALGVTQGMTRVEVETFQAATQLPRSLVEEAAAKQALLECAGAFSPRIEDRSSDTSFVCVIDIAGTEKLFGSTHTLCKALLQRVRALGFRVSIAVSNNFDTAICMARGMNSTIKATVIAPGEESAALSTMPLGVLDLSVADAETFAVWGIHSLGMLAELPEHSLIARMGQAGKRLRQLARGEFPHLFRPVDPAFALAERMELDTPVELLDSLLFVIGMMLEQLILRAEARIYALASITITLSLEGGALHMRTVRPALPTNYKQLWVKLMHLDLEAHPPEAAILSIAMAAEHGKTSKVQLGLFSPQLPEPMRLDVTLARIRAIVGEDRVGRAVLKDTHRSHGIDDHGNVNSESFSIAPFTVASRSNPQSVPRQSCTATSIRQVRPAENVHVTVRGRRPETFFFRDKRYTVEDAYGPWLASGDWWNPTLWNHEQWDLVARSVDGALLCCCLLLDTARNCWRMVALYD